MKIAALITTRGKPQQVVGIIESMRMLSTGENELEFLVACDDDDSRTTDMISEWSATCYGGGVRVYEDERPTGPGACWNRLAKLTDAEAMITLPDDGIIATPNWDRCIDWAWRNHDWIHPDLRIGGLRDSANPGQPTQFVLGKRWVEMIGHVFDDRYPFWFSDTAIGETYSFITGQGIPMLPIDVVGKAGDWNPRLRKMAFWWCHFGFTRRERLETASNIRRELNLAVPPNLADLEGLWAKRDAEGLPASEEIVRQITKPAPLDARYLEAERAAIEYVKANGGPIFEP